jgi:hypothetical protein
MKQPQQKYAHDPINKSQRKKIWILFQKRDVINNELNCTLCNQPELFEDSSNEYKMTIGHLNIRKYKYKKYYNSNHEANLTPQHNICNQRLQGVDFYMKHEGKLIATLEKNIAWSIKLQTVKKERVIDLLGNSSDIQNEKSRLYDGVCEKYLHTVLQNPNDEIPVNMAKDDISGICKNLYKFGDPVSVVRHLRIICNRFNMLYVIEENSDRVQIIRQMRKDEREVSKEMLKNIEPPKSLQEN